MKENNLNGQSLDLLQENKHNLTSIFTQVQFAK